MKKPPLLFLSLVALGLCSFALFENQAAAPPIEEAVYKEYLSLFKKVELPYTINKNNIAWKKTQFINSNFKHFIPDLGHQPFRRGGGETPVYYPEVLIASTHEFNMVIYSETTKWNKSSPDLYLQTIDKKGDVISNVYLINLNDDASSFCTIDKDLKIRSNSTYADESKRFRINKEGKISKGKAG